MKVLLVRPGYENLFAKINIVNVEPLELEYLYTLCQEEGYTCRIYDAVINRTAFIDVIKAFQPDVVAFTGYINQKNIILKYAETLKKFNSQAIAVIGGIHAELNYQDFYSSNIDYIVHSGGIEPFREILKLKDSTKATKDIPGICYRLLDNTWMCNEKTLINPDTLPIPDRTFFQENKHHFRYLNLSPCATVKASYSCPHQCNFCYCCQLNSGKYVVRNVAKVVEEIAGIDCENIWILDDTFYIDHQRVYEFAKLIKEQGIKKNFIIYYRADFIVNNEGIITLLKEIGLKVVLVGLEAFDDTLLKDYNKLTSKEINEKCIQILKKHQIECTGLFIVDIDATKKDFQTLRDYVKKYELKVSTAAILTPLPGTFQYEKYKDRIITDNPKHWDFLHLVAEPGNMGKAQYYFEFYKFYLKLLFMNKKQGTFSANYIRHILSLAKGYVGLCRNFNQGINRIRSNKVE